jgi:hypothetical protein
VRSKPAWPVNVDVGHECRFERAERFRCDLITVRATVSGARKDFTTLLWRGSTACFAVGGIHLFRA